jgi:hypothetical protein
VAFFVKPPDLHHLRGLYHAIVRHALYDRLAPGHRATLHRRAAEALRTLPDKSAARAAEIAAHYYASISLPGAEQCR